MVFIRPASRPILLKIGGTEAGLLTVAVGGNARNALVGEKAIVGLTGLREIVKWQLSHGDIFIERLAEALPRRFSQRMRQDRSFSAFSVH